MPTLEDKNKMHFTNAFILESYRKSSFVHAGVPHFTNEDIKLEDYIIPAKTTIFANLYHVMHDTNYWQEPDLFNPARFLDVQGHFHQDERVIPFSIGKRYCLGQSLAEKEVFLFLTGIIQNFEIISPPGQEIPSIDLYSCYPSGLGRTAPTYEVILRPIK